MEPRNDDPFSAEDVDLLRRAANFIDNKLSDDLEASTPTQAGNRMRALADAIAGVLDRSAAEQAALLQAFVAREDVATVRSLVSAWNGMSHLMRGIPQRATKARHRARSYRLIGRRLERIIGPPDSAAGS